MQKVSSLNTASDFKLSNRSFLGVVEAQESVDVKYDSSKTVAEILVKNGDSVKKGDKLLTYDVEAINLQLEQAKLEVERLQNEIASNKSQPKKPFFSFSGSTAFESLTGAGFGALAYASA